MSYEYKKPRIIAAIIAGVLALVFIITGVVLLLGGGFHLGENTINLTGETQTFTFTPSKDSDYYLITISGESYVSDFAIYDADEDEVSSSMSSEYYLPKYELEAGETYTIEIKGKSGKTLKFGFYDEDGIEDAMEKLEDELEELFD